MNKNKKYDTIELKIESAGTVEKSWQDCDRCIILLNGKDILGYYKRCGTAIFPTRA